MTYQTRYTGFALWLTVIGLLGLMALVLLAGVAQADTQTDVRYTLNQPVPCLTATVTSTPHDFPTPLTPYPTQTPFPGVTTCPTDIPTNTHTPTMEVCNTPSPFGPKPGDCTPTPSPTPTYTPVTPTPSTPTPVTGDSGFRSNPNGWSFTNLSYDTSWDNFRDIFGADQVEWNVGGFVFKDPGALIYYNQANYSNFGKGGQCYGMVTTAALRFHTLIPLPTGVTANNLFQIPQPPTINGYMQPSPVADYIVKYQGHTLGYHQKGQYRLAERRFITETLMLAKTSVDSKLHDPYAFVVRG